MVTSETILCKTFKEFNTFIEEHKNSTSEIAYDVETNARPVHSKDHRVIGFSIAFDEHTGCYVPIKALDFELTPMDKRLIEKKTNQLLSNNTTLVYNCMHEYPVTLSWLNLELPKVQDLFVMVKLMMGKAKEYQGNAGLKMQSVMHLGYDNWSDDVQIYFKFVRELSKYENKMKKLLAKYYDEKDIPDLITAMYNIPEEELNRDVISYEYIPYKLVGAYGSLDSTVLFGLRDFYFDWMKKESDELGINLFKGYDYWQKHHYAGYTLERNGAYWNDEIATEVENWCKSGMVEALQNLLKSDLTKPQIEATINTQYMSYVLNNYTNILTPEFIPLKVTKNSLDVICQTASAETLLKSMSLQPKITKAHPKGKWHLALGNFNTIVEQKRNSGEFNDQEIKNQFYDRYLNSVINSNDVDVMKNLFNPNQTGSKFYKFLNQVLITDDIKIAQIFFNIFALTEEPGFDIDYYKDFYDMASEYIDNYPKYKKNFDIKEFKKNNIQYSYKDSSDSKLIEFVLKLKGSDIKDKFRLFKKQLGSLQGSLNNRRLCKIIYDTSNLTFDTFDDDTIISIFELYEFTGINIDDSSTWNNNFTWLYNFRWFKKYGKILSTYIYGIVGRSSVWYVPKKEFESGERFTKRCIPYYVDPTSKKKIPSVIEDPDNYDMVLQTNFHVNEADSGRWKATMHTIPSGTTIKGIIQSRYKGGIIAMPDCSQAEVRVLARASKDENLIAAFRDGLDIHRFVASLIFQKEMNEVTSRERKVAKSAVFGLLYGESEQAFADEHFGGDLNKAKEIYTYFYKAFPNIKGYIDDCHNNYDKFKKAVLYITDRYIDMSKIKADNRDKDKIYRQSQNFPIQGSTCDVAGLILYGVCNHIETNKLKSKPICFIHDSIEIDIPPEETFIMLDALKPLFNKYPDDEFGIPMASDIVFSCNMGAEIEVKELIHNDDFSDVKITLEGIDTDINEVITNWKSVYASVEKDLNYEETSEEIYVPLRGLFMKKAVISKDMGKYKHKVSCKYHVKVK